MSAPHNHLVGGVKAEVDPDVGGGRGGGVFPFFDGARGRFCQDGIAAGNLDEVHRAARGDDDIQADDASDGGPPQVRRVLGCDLGNHFSDARGLVSLLGAHRGDDPNKQEGQTEDEPAKQSSRGASFPERARWFYWQQVASMGRRSGEIPANLED